MNKHLRIIIVDDHEVVRLGLRALLDRHPGFTVVDEASNAKEAVQKALQHHPEVVVMDIRLPGGSGIDACREIVAEAPDINADADVSSAGEIRMNRIIAGGGGVVLAIGKVFEQGREFLFALGSVRHVESRGEANTVGHRDPLLYQTKAVARWLGRGRHRC